MTSGPSPVPVPEVGGVRSRKPTTLPPLPLEYGRLEQLYAIQNVLAQPLALEEASDALLAIVAQALHVRTAVLIDTAASLQRVFTWSAAGIAPAALEETREHARKVTQYLSRSGTAATSVVNRTALLPGGVSEPAFGTRQFVTLPLALMQSQVFGVFQLEGASVFDERDLLFINAVANQLAVALERYHAQLELATARATAEHANRRLRDLQAIAKVALEGTTLAESLFAVLRAVCSMFATDAAAVLLVNPDGKTLRSQASIGVEATSAAEIARGSGAAGTIAAAGTAMFFDDLDDCEGAAPRLGESGIRSLLGAPIRARNRLIGVVYVASRERRAFTYDDLQLLELVEDRIGTIIENATLYEQALAAIRTRDVVMGVVSHDLSNPISTIQLCTELMSTRDPPDVQAMIKRALGVMSRLIGDLRDVGSIEAGQLSMQTQVEDARALLHDAVETLKDVASKKHVCLDVRVPTRDLVIDCDRIRIIQVVTNLLSNAIKFAPKGSSITISMTEAEPGCARFSVQDTGPGISAIDLPRVFDRYWQAKATAHLGTGLGLAIAKGIVEAHRGTISVESTVGQGTTFAFSLPLARDPVVVPSRDSGDEISSRQRVAAHAHARVLAVDDEPNALDALACLLEDEGFVVETARNGLEALPKLREFAPDILLVDVEMPGLNGPELVRKAREERPDLPVILMTGHGDHVVASAELESRAGYIGKPLDSDALFAAIHRELDKER